MLADATTQYVREGWSPTSIVNIIAAVTALIVAVTALLKQQGLRYDQQKEAKAAETRHNENAREIQATKEQVKEVQTDVRAVRTDLVTVAAISTPNTKPLPIVPADIHQMISEGKGQ